MKRTAKQKRLDLILNGKGGVGKSFFAVNLVQYLKDHSVEHVAIDTDNENSTLKRFHPDAIFVDLSKPTAIDGLFSELDSHSLVIVDCRAASTDIFLDYFAELNVFDVLRELSASLTLISPVNRAG
jgi:cellulose biosynthesis protein BcsQ